jgi:hypothetical protein
MASGQPVTANSSLGVMTLDAATSASITGPMPRQERSYRIKQTSWPQATAGNGQAAAEIPASPSNVPWSRPAGRRPCQRSLLR